IHRSCLPAQELHRKTYSPVPDLVVHPVVAVSGVEQLSAATFTVSSPLPVEVMTALESARIPASGP
ncbi:hypothetical protein, partial [Kocuria rosea]|uniref:hypothetical protein n=1 Tax=Kocuria rosea TaxID=1275 RepID=UPI003D34A629